MKQMFEKRILTLEEQMERVSVKLDKVVEGTKSAMRYEAKGLSTLNEKAKKQIDVAPGEKDVVGERQVVEEASIDKAAG